MRKIYKKFIFVTAVKLPEGRTNYMIQILICDIDNISVARKLLELCFFCLNIMLYTLYIYILYNFFT